uniref:Late nodulin-like protein n=1 Tax=Astragalus sinicus TaxID=47065 RepID=Q07A32_ASTSI|nr:late nodulin-like protein [Astragalus sinicus]
MAIILKFVYVMVLIGSLFLMAINGNGDNSRFIPFLCNEDLDCPEIGDTAPGWTVRCIERSCIASTLRT